MRFRLRSRSVLPVLLFLLLACTHPPPTLSPQAQQAFEKTRVLKALDLFRDTVVEGQAQTPPVFSEATLVKVVTYHRSAVKIMQASDAGWKVAVLQGLDEAVRDLPAKQSQIATPYVALLKTILQEIP